MSISGWFYGALLGVVLWHSLNEDFCFLVDEGEDFAKGVHLSA